MIFSNGFKKYNFIEKIKNLNFVKEVWLFGSRARGDNEDKSDIDLAIVCKENTTDFDWNKIIDIIENRDTLLMVDFVRFDKLNNGKFKDNILRDKKVL